LAQPIVQPRLIDERVRQHRGGASQFVRARGTHDGVHIFSEIRIAARQPNFITADSTG
jgi:hypothetical protein